MLIHDPIQTSIPGVSPTCGPTDAATTTADPPQLRPMIVDVDSDFESPTRIDVQRLAVRHRPPSA